MTESRPNLRTAGGTVDTDADATSDTTALPRIEPATSGTHSASTNGLHNSSNSGSGGNGSSGGISSLGSKLTAAGASAVAAATSAATSAKDALRGSAAEQPGDYTQFDQIGASVTTTSTSVPPPPPPPPAGPAPAKGRPARQGRSSSRQPRKARLTLSHINVYSVFKFSCVLAIALFFVWLIAIGVLYGVLDVAGVLNQVNDAVGKISGSDNPKDVVTGSIVFGGAIIIGAVYIVLFIALSTIGSMVYNLCADLVGGVELTLSERE
jgi:Transmembrane domain of unknown function (DUF3566)